MISHRYRTIFVHVPKTAGQSIELVFVQKSGLTWETRAPLLMRENPDPVRGPRRLAHLKAAEYIDLGYIAPIDYADYFKFAVVRNPWDRLVSAYKFLVGPAGIDFRDFVFNGYPVPGQPEVRRRFEPQWEFVCDSGKNLIVDEVVRFENLEAGIEPIFQRIFGERVPLPRRNVSAERRDYREYFDAETREHVRACYRDDIELFGYDFDRGSS
ncbi:MAG: sulfotransferase family protein [Gammaproteobacteria bacterium]|nr:sulfotransferase family protein [Gammaproteobacteria bacterium]